MQRLVKEMDTSPLVAIRISPVMPLSDDTCATCGHAESDHGDDDTCACCEASTFVLPLIRKTMAFVYYVGWYCVEMTGAAVTGEWGNIIDTGDDLRIDQDDVEFEKVARIALRMAGWRGESYARGLVEDGHRPQRGITT